MKEQNCLNLRESDDASNGDFTALVKPDHKLHLVSTTT